MLSAWKKASWGTGQSKLSYPIWLIHESLDKAEVARYQHEDDQRCQVCNSSWWEGGDIIWSAGWPRLIWNENIKKRMSSKKKKKNIKMKGKKSGLLGIWIWYTKEYLFRIRKSLVFWTVNTRKKCFAISPLKFEYRYMDDKNFL